MLMDLAFDHIDIAPKRRVHFDEFMLETHARLRVAREREEGDPIEPVAEQIAEEAKLLCFDEMQVTNPADAMILSRLFRETARTGREGRHDLQPSAVRSLQRWAQSRAVRAVHRLDRAAHAGGGGQRPDRLSARPACRGRGVARAQWPRSDRGARRAFFQLTDYPVEDRAKVPSEEIDVGGGRTLHVPKSLKGVAVFSFKRLCGEPRGAADYLAIARRYHTVIIVGIPVMGRDMRNEAARFVTLVDALYEHKVKLLAAADAEPEGLYPSGDGSFEFQRTVSRLQEMRSAEYLAEGHGARA